MTKQNGIFAIEEARGCGYRKVGGLYLMAAGLWEPCHYLPIPIANCPTCGHGLKVSRGFGWIRPSQFWNPCPFYELGAKNTDAEVETYIKHCCRCPACNPEIIDEEKNGNGLAGLIWVGERFYSAESFSNEVARLGVSRRLAAYPKDFKIGMHYVFLAHRKVKFRTMMEGPGIFSGFRPTHFELLAKEGEYSDDEKMELWEKKRIKIIDVPEWATEHFPKKKEKKQRRYIRKEDDVS